MRRFRPCSLPARKNPGSDLSERPACAREGHFRGGAPARPIFRSPCPRRTARIANSLLDKALERNRMFRGKANRVSLPHQMCFGAAFPPKQRAKNVSPARPQPARCGRRHDDSANTGRGDGGHGRLVPAPAASVVIAVHTVSMPDNPASFYQG